MTSYSSRHHGVGVPDCPVCHGVGYVRYDVPEDHAYFGKAFDCQCRQGDLESGRQAYLRRLSGLEHLGNKTFQSFNPEGVGLDPVQQGNLQRIYGRVIDYAEEPKGWLFISGGYGSGKTHLAAAVANRQIEQGNRVLFVTVPDLLDYLRSAFRPGTNGEEGFETRFDEVRTATLLILDDLGIENSTSWAVEKLFQILNYRYVAHLPTIITTNHQLEELEPRVRSRLSDPDVVQMLSITAPDYRQAGTASTPGDMGGMGVYRHMTFDSFDGRSDLPRAEQTALKRAVQTARDYAEQPEGCLVLMGPYGSGKTHLAAAIANATLVKGIPVLFVTVPDLLDHLRSAYAPTSTISYDKRFQEVRSAPLLILDDLGTESATSWAREKLNQLFNYRFSAGLATVITTVHTLEELEKQNPRLTIRLRDRRMSRIIPITAPAYLGEAERR